MRWFFIPLPMPHPVAPVNPVTLLPHEFPFLLVDRIAVASNAIGRGLTESARLAYNPCKATEFNVPLQSD